MWKRFNSFAGCWIIDFYIGKPFWEHDDLSIFIFLTENKSNLCILKIEGPGEGTSPATSIKFLIVPTNKKKMTPKTGSTTTKPTAGTANGDSSQNSRESTTPIMSKPSRKTELLPKANFSRKWNTHTKIKGPVSISKYHWKVQNHKNWLNPNWRKPRTKYRSSWMFCRKGLTKHWKKITS